MVTQISVEEAAERSFIDPVHDTLVSPKEAALHYKVSKPTVWRWVLSGKVASMKIGASRRTSIEAIARAFGTPPLSDKEG